MRYEKADNLLNLALQMQAARSGLSLSDIQERFDVSRRTAMRMRDAILRVFPQADEVPNDDRTKRWRIPNGTLNKLVEFSADELADLETAVNILDRDNMTDQARSVENVLAKLKAALKPDIARKVEPDLEALLEAENLALRPGPRPKNRTFVLEELRDAIKACKVVTIKYRTRSTGKVSQRKVHPYGFLYGHRHYLVAYNIKKNEEGFRHFSLPNIHKVEVTDEYYERDEDFNLEKFAKASFGVFQGDTVDVVWKFSKRAASDAKDFLFHPDQELKKQDDGSLIVKFRASGQLEMCWHLFAWGEDVEVLEPASLAKLCEDHRPSWPGLP
jgi:predicted DNA-binding transcriptional regulator YafY